MQIKQFKNLLGFMGDRKYQCKRSSLNFSALLSKHPPLCSCNADPAMLAVEFLNSGIQGSDDLKVEAYVQVMKQLTENPTRESVAKGWVMMSLLLSCFPPSPTIENYVAVFINSHVSCRRLAGACDL